MFGAPDLKKEEEAGQGGSRLGVAVHNLVLRDAYLSADDAAADLVIDTCAPIEDAIVSVVGLSRPVSGSSTVPAIILAHELVAQTAQTLSKRGIELPVFASPTIAGVTLHDTDIIYGVYRERMPDAQKKHLPAFQKRMQGK